VPAAGLTCGCTLRAHVLGKTVVVVVVAVVVQVAGVGMAAAPPSGLNAT
jgi:hypothetical protein